jgi:membrane protein DedA with SNARE-associated domain
LRWFIQTFTYFALILLLIAAGMGVPVPEDIPLVTSGYMANPEHSPIRDTGKMVDTNGDGVADTLVPRKVPNVYLMMVAGMIGVLCGDSVVYYIGRKGIEGDNFVARHLRKVMTPRRRTWTEKHFSRHGNLTVFCGRFMPGLRSVVFAFAGMARIGYVRFIAIDGLAALISVPTFIWVGYYFADRFTQVLQWIERVKHILVPVVLLATVMAVLLYLVRRKTSRTAVPAPAGEEELRAIAAVKGKKAEIAGGAVKP